MSFKSISFFLKTNINGVIKKIPILVEIFCKCKHTGVSSVYIFLRSMFNINNITNLGRLQSNIFVCILILQ